MRIHGKRWTILLAVVLGGFGIFWMGLAAEASAQAGPAKKLKIGVAGPLKFPWGKNMAMGAQVAAEQINAAGGVQVKGTKYEIEVIAADSNDYSSVVDAVNTVKRFVTVDKVNFIIGGARSEATLAQQEVMADYKTVYMFSAGGSPALHARLAENYERYKYFFNMFPHSIDQNRMYGSLVDLAATKIRSELGIAKPKVGLVMEKARWADDMVKAAEATLPKMGMEVGGVWRPSPFASDLSSEVTAIKAAGVQIIYEVFTGPAAVVLNRQIGELQAPVVVCGVNTEGVGMGKKYWEATNGMCEFETIIAYDCQNIEITERTKPAWDVLSKRMGEIPYQTAYTCYDAVYMFKEAMEKSGSLESDVLVRELENANFRGTLGIVKFHPKGTKWPHAAVWGPGAQTALGQQWQKGSLVTVWPSGQTPNAVLEPGSGWEGLKYKGTGEFLLPPRVVKAWKK